MRTIDGYTITDNFEIIGLRGKLLKGYVNSKGYRVSKNIKFHVLIARAYPEICGEYYKGCVVHHKDGNKLNNEPQNLIIISKEEHDNLHKEGRGFQVGSEPWNKGGTFTEESKNKMSESAKKRGANYMKKVVQMKDGKIIREWDCAMNADKETGISFKAISACCHNKQKHAGEYEWKFA